MLIWGRGEVDSGTLLFLFGMLVGFMLGLPLGIAIDMVWWLRRR